MEEKKESSFFSVADKYPELAEQWDVKANGNRTPQNTPCGSHYKAFWNCPKCGMSYQAAVFCRTSKGSDCPYCSNRLAIPGVTSLQARYPDIALDWDYIRNGTLTPDEVLPGSSQLVWWHCTDGHIWATTVQSRVNGSRCPRCVNRRPAILRLV